MKETPLLFKPEMVRACLEGRKTQTRRLIKLPRWALPGEELEIEDNGHVYAVAANTGCLAFVPCPYGDKGDYLWVKETHVIAGTGCVFYRADGEPEERDWSYIPSIFMRREYSRITLSITTVRAERLQDISEGDAIDEGMPHNWIDGMPGWDAEEHGYIAPHLIERYRDDEPSDPYHATAIEAYSQYWDYINGKGAWDANPWVWVIEFKRLEDKR